MVNHNLKRFQNILIPFNRWNKTLTYNATKQYNYKKNNSQKI